MIVLEDGRSCDYRVGAEGAEDGEEDRLDTVQSG